MSGAVDDVVFASHAATRSADALERRACQDEVVVAQQVVDVQAGDAQHLGVGHVAAGALDARRRRRR